MSILHAEIRVNQNLENNSTNDLMPKLPSYAEHMASTDSQQNNSEDNLEENDQQENLEENPEEDDQQDNLEEDSAQPGHSHCFMALPNDVAEIKEQRSETCQGTPTEHEEMIKSMLDQVTMQVHQTYMEEEVAAEPIPPILPAPVSSEQDSLNDEDTRSRKELSEIIIAKTTSWEKLSSEQVIFRESSTHIEHEHLKLEEEPNKSDDNQSFEETVRAKNNKNNLEGRNYQRKGIRMPLERNNRDCFNRLLCRNGTWCWFYDTGNCRYSHRLSHPDNYHSEHSRRINKQGLSEPSKPLSDGPGPRRASPKHIRVERSREPSRSPPMTSPGGLKHFAPNRHYDNPKTRHNDAKSPTSTASVTTGNKHQVEGPGPENRSGHKLT